MNNKNTNPSDKINKKKTDKQNTNTKFKPQSRNKSRPQSNPQSRPQKVVSSRVAWAEKNPDANSNRKKLHRNVPDLTGAGHARNKSFTAQQVIDALALCRGQITYAAKYLGTSFVKLKAYVNANDRIKDTLKNIEENNLDFVESKLFDLIEAREKTAIIFYLKTKGKKRGYIEDEKVDLSKLTQPITFIYKTVTRPDVDDAKT